MFGGLDGVAFLTLGHKVLDVFVHAPPDIQLFDQTACGSYAWVGHVMSHLHDGGLQHSRNQDPGLPGGGVHQQDIVVHLVLLHVEAAVVLQALNIRATSLFVTHMQTRDGRWQLGDKAGDAADGGVDDGVQGDGVVNGGV